MTDNEAFQESQTDIFTTSSSLDLKLQNAAKISYPKKTKSKKKNDRIRMAVAIVGFIVSILIIVIGAVLGALAKKNKGKDEAAPSFRLPSTLKPTKYDVRLQPFVNGNFSIHGYVKVTLEVLHPTNRITLHMADIITHNDTIQVRSYMPEEGEEEEDEGEEVAVSKHEYDTEREWYVAHLDKELQVNQIVVISMRFTGLLNDKLKGFYRSSYTTPDGDTVRLAVTFFSPINARRAFPCLDEPAMKAKFRVSLAREENMTALANMPLRSTEPIEGQEGWVWDHFNTTVRMSTYLIAFMVSDFQHVSNKDISVWSRGEAVQEARHALEVGPKLLEYFEDFLRVPYALPKMDIVALPDFAAGAMENWGLLTFREENLLIPQEVAASRVQRVETVVAHELAHQWFGNLVTAAWWTDILLKEGMAAFMENLGTDAVEPEWGMMEQLVLTMQNVMVSDGLASTHPVNQPVSRPADIGQIFDSITYSKGVSVIRMMYYFLTEDTFRMGLTNYLNQYAYDVATQDDFWAILTKVASKEGRLPTNTTLKDIMDTWTLQSGYPVLTVTRDEGGHVASLQQERFLLIGDTTGEGKENRKEEEASQGWWLPLSYTDAEDADFTQPEPSFWMPAEHTAMVMEGLPAKESWVLFNLQGTGYFRVNYDQDNWARLTDQLTTNYSVIEVRSRSQLLDDALSLARGGRLSYDTALGLHSYLSLEKEYVPWETALAGLSYLEKMLTRTANYGNLKLYLLNLVTPVYGEVGFQEGPSDSHLQQLLRSLAVAWACKLDHEDCVTEAVKEFDSWLMDNTTVSPNIKETVYCMGVAEGGQEAWEGVWERYQESGVASEKILLLNALGCSREPWLLSRYLDMAFTEDSGIKKQDANSIFFAVSDNDIGRSLAWNFLRSEWDRIVNYYDTFSSASGLLTSVTAEFNTRVEQQELEDFCKLHQASLSTSSRAVKTVLENTAGNVAWMEKYYEDIGKWLQKNVEDLEKEEEVV